MRQTTNRLSLLAIIATAVFLSGCNHESSPVRTPVNVNPEPIAPVAEQVVSGPVRGQVVTDEPVVGASVTLATHDGALLPGTAVTDADGRFEVPVTQARYGLRVIAKGGSTASAGKFSGELSAYIEPFDAEVDVYLTPVTTMADRLRISDSRSFVDAESRIGSYLVLDAGRSVRADFLQLRDFNSRIFMQEAAPYGFDALIDTIVADAATDDYAQRRFDLEGLQIAPLASAIGMELIKGAASETGARLAGKALSAIGLDGGTGEILSKLNAISLQIEGLQRTVDDIRREVKQTQLNLSVDIAKQTIGYVRTLTNDLQALTKLSGSAQEDERRRIESTILARLDDDRAIISHMLNGELGVDGSPIQIYAEYLRDTIHFYSQQHYNKYADFIEYYDALNTQLYYLLIEALNAKSLREHGVASARVPLLEKEISAARAKYRARLPSELPNKNMFIEVDTLLMWYGSLGNYAPYTAWNATTMVPPELEIKKGWVVPSFEDVRHGFRGGVGQVVSGGAPAHLFNSGPIFIWSSTGVYSINQFVWDVTKNDWILVPRANRAHFFAYRRMQLSEVEAYWFPWLYPQRSQRK